ncbi:energy transducer TonB [Methylacidiphilum caldifontis]|uniref:TonB C-terminal domain-containing protein n=1 Tax=Methylacidiphilum caldifontis TaxID=2795386 RepID=A0A4Y8P8P4_9BACT|nr:energy transducer TonB [Methylacidiphilum caldifontis]TFE66999.1 hypothetical protein A7Q10_01730 [Methylacidiphilum caldifontis]
MNRLVERKDEQGVKELYYDKIPFVFCLGLAFFVHLGGIFFLSKGFKIERLEERLSLGKPTDFYVTLSPDDASMHSSLPIPEKQLPFCPKQLPEEQKISKAYPSLLKSPPVIPHTNANAQKKLTITQTTPFPSAQKKTNSKREFQNQNTATLSYASLPPPPYPYEARLLRMEGSVVIRLHVQEGKIVSTEIIRSSGYRLLDMLSKRWVETHWHFPPFVNRVILEKITFELEEDSPSQFALN